MRRFTDKLLAGKPVSLSAVGGSVTAGQGAAHGQPVMNRIWNWILEVSPQAQANHTLKHGAFGGSTSGQSASQQHAAQSFQLPARHRGHAGGAALATWPCLAQPPCALRARARLTCPPVFPPPCCTHTAAIFTVCVNDMVQPDVDLVLVEFAVNDPKATGRFRDPDRLSFERLLRKLLEFENRWRQLARRGVRADSAAMSFSVCIASTACPAHLLPNVCVPCGGPGPARPEPLLTCSPSFCCRPAVVLLQHYSWFTAGGGGEKRADYTYTAENDFNVLGKQHSSDHAGVGPPNPAVRAAHRTVRRLSRPSCRMLLQPSTMGFPFCPFVRPPITSC